MTRLVARATSEPTVQIGPHTVRIQWDIDGPEFLLNHPTDDPPCCICGAELEMRRSLVRGLSMHVVGPGRYEVWTDCCEQVFSVQER